MDTNWSRPVYRLGQIGLGNTVKAEGLHNSTLPSCQVQMSAGLPDVVVTELSVLALNSMWTSRPDTWPIFSLLHHIIHRVGFYFVLCTDRHLPTCPRLAFFWTDMTMYSYLRIGLSPVLNPCSSCFSFNWPAPSQHLNMPCLRISGLCLLRGKSVDLGIVHRHDLHASVLVHVLACFITLPRPATPCCSCLSTQTILILYPLATDLLSTCRKLIILSHSSGFTRFF